MTQIYITIGVISIVAALVCYIFIRQTMSDKRQEKERLHRALVKRAKELLHMISAFPDDFLPQEIKVFIYRCVIDAYQQLSKLEPSDKQYVEALKVHSAQLEAVIRTPDSKKTVNLQSAAQINELKQYLTLLGRFSQKSAQRNNITQKQYSHYRMLIKGLNAKLAVDGYILSAKQATEINKRRLAIHYYELAKKLLTKETPPNFQDQITRINAAMEPLMEMEALEKERLATEAASKKDTDDTNASTAPEGTSTEDKEWAQFEEDSGWKKKNVYD